MGGPAELRCKELQVEVDSLAEQNGRLMAELEVVAKQLEGEKQELKVENEHLRERGKTMQVAHRST